MAELNRPIDDLPAEFRTARLELLPEGLQTIAVKVINSRFGLKKSKRNAFEEGKNKILSHKSYDSYNVEYRLINHGYYDETVFTRTIYVNVPQSKRDIYDFIRQKVIADAKGQMSDPYVWGLRDWKWHDDEVVILEIEKINE